MTMPFGVEVQFTGEMTIPPVESITGAATSGLSYRMALVGAGTKVINVDAAAGAKLVLVRSFRTNTNTITLKLGTSTVGQEITPGGMFLLVSPNPTAGITSISIEYTADTLVDCWVLG